MSFLIFKSIFDVVSKKIFNLYYNGFLLYDFKIFL